MYGLYLIYKRLRNGNNAIGRRWWVRPLNLDRNYTGYFNTTFLKMKAIDLEEFFIQTRMRRPEYDLLLELVKGDLSKSSMREPISAECRLAVTLW